MYYVMSTYCADYKSAQAVKEAFYAGKDFLMENITSEWHGKPCSIRNLKEGDKVELRYANKRRMTVCVV